MNLKNLFNTIERPSHNYKCQVTLLPILENEKYALPYFNPNYIIFKNTDTINGCVLFPLDRKHFKIDNAILYFLGEIRDKNNKLIKTFNSIKKLLFQQVRITEEVKKSFQIELSDQKLPSFYGNEYKVQYYIKVKIQVDRFFYSTSIPFYIINPIPRLEISHPFIKRFNDELFDISFCLKTPYFDVTSYIWWNYI